MDKLDSAIAAAISHDPRSPYVSLGQEVGAAATTVRDRLDALVTTGAVRVIAAPDPESLGYAMTAIIGVVVHAGRLASMVEQLCQLPEIRTVAVTVGRFDLIAELTCRDEAHLRELIDVISRKRDHVARFELFIGMKRLPVSGRSSVTEPRVDAPPSGKRPDADLQHGVCLRDEGLTATAPEQAPAQPEPTNARAAAITSCTRPSARTSAGAVSCS